MEERGEHHNIITYARFFRNKNGLLLITAAVMTMLIEYYIDPIIGKQMLELGVSEQNVGYIFAASGCAFGIGALVAGQLCQRISRIYVMLIGFIGMALSLLLIGPCQILHLPKKVWLMYIGVFIKSFFASFEFVTTIPELIATIELEELGAEGQEESSN